MAIHRAWKAWDPLGSLKEQRQFQFVWILFSRLLTLCVVLVGWIFFRAKSWTVAMQYLSRILTWSHEGTRLLSPYILAAVVAVFNIHLFVYKDRNWAHEIPQRTVPVRIAAYAVLVLLLACLGATDSAPFICFQF